MTDTPIKMTTRWKLLHSFWLVVTLIPLGLMAYIGFFYVGIRTRNKDWMIIGFIYLVTIMTSFWIVAIVDKGRFLSGIFVLVLLIAWFVCIIHRFSIRKQYLHILFIKKGEYMAEINAKANKKVGKPTIIVKQGQPLGKLTQPKPQVININKATEMQISALPTIHPFLAKVIVQKRNRGKKFTSIKQLSESINVQPHLLKKSVPYIAFTEDQVSVLKQQLAATENNFKTRR